MSYDVGTHIDLSSLNKPRQAVAARQKKSFPEATRQLYDVGTEFIFQITPAGFKAAVRIPVAYA